MKMIINTGGWRNKLPENDITIISVKDITGMNMYLNKEYTIKDEFHPNKEAWEIIVPALAKKLNIDKAVMI